MISHCRRARAPLLAGLLATCAAGVAHADVARYSLGGGFLGGAQLDAGAVYRDNFFYESDGGISATGFRLRPEVNVVRDSSTTSLALDGNIEHVRYDLPGNRDQYLDYGGSGRLGWNPFSKHGFELSAGYERNHDQPGLVRTEDSPQFDIGGVDEWERTRVGMSYTYGSPSGLASNQLRVDYRGREYLTNRDATRPLNYDGLQLGYLLAYAYSPKTSVLFNIDHNSTRFETRAPGGASRDGNEFLVRTGLRWLGTAKTSGQVLVGARSYSLDGRSRPSREDFSWRANFDWVPVATTSIRLSTGQNTSETYRNDTLFIDNRSADLRWRQSWSERFISTASFGYRRSDFVGSNRIDKTFDYGVSTSYVLLRNVDVFADFLMHERNSDRAAREYEAPEARVGLHWTL